MSVRLARVLFACVSNTHLDSTSGHLLVTPLRMQKHGHTHRRMQGWYSVWRLKPFPFNVALGCSACCLCLRCWDVWNGACPYICLLYSPLSSSGYGLSQSSRRVDLSADGVNCTPLPVKARGTISALYTITHQQCSDLQIGVHIALGLVLHFVRVSDSN